MSTTVKFYPDPHPETSTFDGCLVSNAWSVNFTDVRNLADAYPVSGYSDDSHSLASWAGGIGYNAGSRYFSGLGYQIVRSQYLFRYTVPIGATINSVKIGLYPELLYDQDNDAEAYLAIVETTPPSDTGMTTTDGFNDFGTTLWSNEVDITGMSTGQYNEFTFNDTGKSQIIIDGDYHILKAGLREGHDIENVALAASNGQNAILSYFSEYEDTSRDPYLEITYTIGKTSFVLPMFKRD